MLKWSNMNTHKLIEKDLFEIMKFSWGHHDFLRRFNMNISLWNCGRVVIFHFYIITSFFFWMNRLINEFRISYCFCCDEYIRNVQNLFNFKCNSDSRCFRRCLNTNYIWSIFKCIVAWKRNVENYSSASNSKDSIAVWCIIFYVSVILYFP